MSDTAPAIDIDPPGETPAGPATEFVPVWRVDSVVPHFHTSGKPWARLSVNLSTLDVGERPDGANYFRPQAAARRAWQDGPEAAALRRATELERANDAAVRKLSLAVDRARDAVEDALRADAGVEQAEAKLAQLLREHDVLKTRQSVLKKQRGEALAKARAAFRTAILTAQNQGRAACQTEYEAAAAELALLAGPLITRILGALADLAEGDMDQLRGDPGNEIK